MSSDSGAVTVTGANGFIGRNLRVRLAEAKREVVPITRYSTEAELRCSKGNGVALRRCG